MVPPSKRFRPIQRIASHKERKAAAVLGESLKQREAARLRLDELRQYRAEYLERFAGATRSGLSSSHVLEYQVFISKLETAIAQQEEILARSEKDCDGAAAIPSRRPWSTWWAACRRLSARMRTEKSSPSQTIARNANAEITVEPREARGWPQPCLPEWTLQKPTCTLHQYPGWSRRPGAVRRRAGAKGIAIAMT